MADPTKLARLRAAQRDLEEQKRGWMQQLDRTRTAYSGGPGGLADSRLNPLNPQSVFTLSGLGQALGLNQGGSQVPVSDPGADTAVATPAMAPPQIAPLPAPQPVMPQKMRLTNRQTTVQRQNALYTPQEADDFKQSAVGQLKERYGALQERKQKSQKTLDLLAQQSLQARAKEKELQAMGHAKSADYKRAKEEYAEARRDLKAAKIDPDRYVKSMSTTQRVMSVVGAMFSGFAVGFSGRGQNVALQMLNRAIDRDVAAQREDVRKLAQNVNLTAQQKRDIHGQWKDTENARRMAALRITSTQLKIRAIEEQDDQASAKYAQLGAALERQYIDLKSKTRDRKITTSTSTSREVMVTPKAAPGAQMDKSTLRKLKENMAQFDTGEARVKRLINKLLQAKSKYAALGGGFLSDSAGRGLATDIKKEVQMIALFNRKVMGDSGPITATDVPMFDLIGTKGGMGRTSTMLRRARQFLSDLRTAKVRAVKYARATPDQLTQEALSGARQASQRNVARAALKKKVRAQ